MRWSRRIAAGLLALCVTAASLLLVPWLKHGPRPATNNGNGDVALTTVTHAGHSYTVAEIDPGRADLRLYWKRPDHTRYGTFDALSADLAARGHRLLFATNAGIFKPDFAPCGLHVEDGHELAPLTLAAGTGNFYLRPNGVFFVDNAGPRVVESTAYPGTTPHTRLATQSGPLLVIGGKIHPAFAGDSIHRRLRSGVGVSSAGRVVFALSRARVTFYELAVLFRDRLKCPDALYLDGEISQFFPAAEGSDAAGDFAGMIGATARQ